MCKKCSNDSCCGCSGNSSGNLSEMASQIASLLSSMEELQAATAWLTGGHPIIALDDASDIALFDPTTGLGSGIWTGWGIANGTTYAAYGFTTKDYRDRFMVGGLGSYSIGSTGGAATVVLTIAEMPAHAHTLTDPGHTHLVDDPGHNHAVDDPGHTHAANSGSHTHTFTTDPGGDHNHTYTEWSLAGSDFTAAAGASWDASPQSSNTSDSGTHTHTGTTEFSNVITTITAAFTGISTDDAFTGITNDVASTGITMANTGGGDAHENLPPYSAVLFVQKL